MATFQLTLVKEQIDEAVSGAYRALRDPWGYTGNSKVIGDSFSSFLHMGSGAVADFFTVSGDQTGHGILANKLFTDLKDLSVTGNTYLPSITGYANANHITTETGYFPYITGDLVKHGNTSFTGALFNFTGDDVSFKLNNAKNFTIELASGEGGDILLTGYDELAFRGDSVIFDNKLNGHTILGEVKHTEGTLNVTENAYFSGEIYQSGSPINLAQYANIAITGNYNVGFYGKGELLAGVGVKTGENIPAGTHGQLLQVDTSAGGGNAGLKWVDSGIFASAGVGSGISGHRSVVSVDNFVTLAPDEQFAVPATDLSMGIQTKGAGGLYATDETLKGIGFLGDMAVDFQLLTSSNDQIAGGDYSTIAGGRNNRIHPNSSGAFVVGVDNRAEYGDYSFIGGVGNQSSGHGVVMIGRKNNWRDEDDREFPTTNYSIMLGSGNRASYPVGVGASQQTIFDTTIKNILIGFANEASGSSNAFIFGEENQFNTGYVYGAAITNCLIMGESNLSDAQGGTLIGYENQASATASNGVVLGSYGFADRFREFVWSVAAGYQNPNFLMKGQTTDATVTEIFLGGTTDKRITIPTDTSMTLRCIVSARVARAGTESASYEVSLFAKNDAGTITVTQDTLNVIHEDDATWTIAWSADTPNLSAVLKVTGAASKTIDWAAHVTAIEITN